MLRYFTRNNTLLLVKFQEFLSLKSFSSSSHSFRAIHASHVSHVIAPLLPPTSHTFHEAEPFQSSLIMSLAFSEIMYAGAFVWPTIMVGIMLAPTTLRPSIPCTRNLWSTTSEFPWMLILHVPAKWSRVDTWRATQAQYALLKASCLHPGNGTSVALKRLNAFVEATSIACDQIEKGTKSLEERFIYLRI